MAHDFWLQAVDREPLRTPLAVLSSLLKVSGVDLDLGDIVETARAIQEAAGHQDLATTHAICT
jgi:hypothetical protein